MAGSRNPARIFPLQDAEKAWEDHEVLYFLKSLVSLARYDPDSCSWRTSQRLLFEEQNELLENFAASGMTVDGAFYPLRMWARITDGKDGGVLPGDGRLWMTPKAGNCGMTARTTGRPLERSTHLQAQVHYWPTPRANKIGGYSSKRFRPTLEETVKMWPTPTSRAGQNPGEHGQGGQNLATVAGGQLNPTWVELLMGYPPGWTDLT